MDKQFIACSYNVLSSGMEIHWPLQYLAFNWETKSAVILRRVLSSTVKYAIHLLNTKTVTLHSFRLQSTIDTFPTFIPFPRGRNGSAKLPGPPPFTQHCAVLHLVVHCAVLRGEEWAWQFHWSIPTPGDGDKCGKRVGGGLRDENCEEWLFWCLGDELHTSQCWIVLYAV